MKIKNNTKKTLAILILTIFFMNIGIPGVINPIMSLASNVATMEELPTDKGVTYNERFQEPINPGTTKDGIIEYSLDGINFSTQLPTVLDAGIYTVYYRIIGDSDHSNSEVFQIIAKVKKRDILLKDVKVEPLALEYQANEQVLVDSEEVRGGVILYSTDNKEYSVKVPKAKDVNFYTIYYKVLGDKNHNDSKIGSVVSTISKANCVLKEEVEAKSITYNGSEQELIKAGVTEDGTIYYSVDGGKSFSSKIPTATNAGTYTIYYKIVGDENHNDSEISTIEVTIDVTEAKITELPKAQNLKFNGEPQELLIEGKTSDGKFEYSLDGNNFLTQIPKQKDAGTYNIYYRVSGDENHSNTEVNTITSTISRVKATIENEPTNKNVSYNGKKQALINPGTTNDGTIVYSLNGENFETEIPTGTEAGTYTVYYKIVGDKNHNNSEIKNVVAKINKQTITLQEIGLVNNFLTYNGQEQNLVDDSNIKGNTLLYSIDNETFSVNIPTAKNVGVYTIYYKALGDKNRNDSEVGNITTIISKADSNITQQVEAKELTYNATEQELIEKGISEDGTILYSLNGKDFSEKVPTGKNAGTYTVYYKVLGDENHKDSSVNSITTKINKAESYIQNLPKTKVLNYTGEPQKLIYEGKTDTGSFEYSLDEENFSTEIPKSIDAGVYTVYYKVAGDNNHNDTEIKIITSTITKVKAEIEEEPTSKNVKYNAQEQEIINAGKSNGGTLQYSTDGGNSFEAKIPTKLNAGTYTVYYKILGDKNHTNSDTKSLTAKIEKKDITLDDITITDNLLKYNGEEQPLLQVQKLEIGTVLYSTDNKIFTMRVPTGKEIGDYTIYIKVIGDRNHNDSEVEKITSIINQPDSKFIEEPTVKNLTHNDQPQQLITPGKTEDGTIEYSLDGENFSTDVPTASAPGTYTIYYRIIGDDNHGDSQVKALEATINEKAENKFPFIDVNEDDWFYNAVKYTYDNNMMKGYNENTFGPNDKLTRGQLVTVIYRMEGEPQVTGKPKFPDVQDSSKYYYKAIKWATDNKVVSGYDEGTFGPDDYITREQLAVIFYKYAKYQGKDVSASDDLKSFTDANQVSKWATMKMKWAVGVGVITGNDTTLPTLNPLGNATRAEVAAMFEKYDKKVK